MAHRRLPPTLLAHAPRMNFLRFCEWLELMAPQGSPLGTTDSPSAEPVRFRSAGSPGFPTREIADVEHDADHPDAPLVVRTTFLGLYGVDARMPSYFVDEIAQRRDGAEPLAAFLDLFHHRIVTQFYRVARKYRYPVGFRADGRDPVSRCMLSLVGLGFGDPEIGLPIPARKLLSMLGLAGQRTRTAEGLAGVLQHVAPDTWIAVEEFHPNWVRLEPGERQPLGQHCVLGRGFHDRSNTVRIVLRPRTRDAVLGLLPDRAMHAELISLLRFYLGYAAQAHIEMHVPSSLMPEPALTSGNAGNAGNAGAIRLGLTTRLTTQLSRLSREQPTCDGDTVTRVQLGRWTGYERPTPMAGKAHASSSHAASGGSRP